MTRRRRRRSGGDHEEHADERWLLTYADLITLLMALFMVLFSMSVVNKSKLASLQESLHNAFSPHVIHGGNAIKRTGGDAQTKSLKPQSNATDHRLSKQAKEDRQLELARAESDRCDENGGRKREVDPEIPLCPDCVHDPFGREVEALEQRLAAPRGHAPACSE